MSSIHDADQETGVFAVTFSVKEHPGTEIETVKVKDWNVDKRGLEERAVVAAAGESPYTHVETKSIERLE
jgi:hypothetical protein